MVRRQMVDWMIEVLVVFHRSTETYFGAVSILDKYLLEPKKNSKDTDIHLIGITCMLISSKLND